MYLVNSISLFASGKSKSCLFSSPALHYIYPWCDEEAGSTIWLSNKIRCIQVNIISAVCISVSDFPQVLTLTNTSQSVSECHIVTTSVFILSWPFLKCSSARAGTENLGSGVHWSQLTLALLPLGLGQMQSNIIHNIIQLHLHFFISYPNLSIAI